MEQLSNVCQVCGKGRKYKSLIFTKDLKTAYCAIPEDCTEGHPNSIVNVRMRGGKMEGNFISGEEAWDLFDAQVDRLAAASKLHDDDIVLSILAKYIRRSISARFPVNVLVAIGRYMEQYNHKNVGTAITEIVTDSMRSYELIPNDPTDYINKRRVGIKQETLDELEQLSPNPPVKEEEKPQVEEVKEPDWTEELNKEEEEEEKGWTF